MHPSSMTIQLRHFYWLAAIVAALGTGFAVGLGHGGFDASDAAPMPAVSDLPSTHTRDPALPLLAARVDELLVRVDALTREQADLQRLIASLEDRVPVAGREADGSLEDPVAVELAAADDPDETSDQRLPSRRNFNSGSTEERLAALEDAGLSSDVAVRIVSELDRVALQRLDINYRAEREGWLRTQRHREEMQAIPSTSTLIRDQFGDEAYDRYLYASGRSNRIRVQQVMLDSAASQAGMRSGDVLLRVDGRPVYSNRDLLAAARTGNAGELVQVELLRDDQRVTTYVPRGPLGVRTRGTRVEP